MSGGTIILVGGPDSGKTNYLGRLWEALRSGHCALTAPEVPTDIKYVEGALEHLMQGHFAPRSKKGFEEDGQSFAIPVVKTGADPQTETELIVPDVSGELWKGAVENCELPPKWMAELRNACAALVFVRVGSDQNVSALDWVTAAEILSIPLMAPAGGAEPAEPKMATQVQLCELLRFLEYALAKDSPIRRPRVAVLVTAWDRLDAGAANKGPSAYLRSEYPLFAGRLEDVGTLDVAVFGVSVVGGDFVDGAFREQFLKSDFKNAGYVVDESSGKADQSHDLTLPVAWAIEGLQSIE